MGDVSSQPKVLQPEVMPVPVVVQQVVSEDEYFVVEPMSKMGLNLMDPKKYIWVDPKMYNGENQKYLGLLKEIIQIDSCTSAEGARDAFEDGAMGEKFQLICAASLPDEQYKILQNEPKVEKIILFCQKEERAKLLKSNFSKIESAQFNFEDLIETVKKNNQTKKAELKGTNALFMTEEDTNSLNKHRLNYACLCQNHSQGKAKQDLIDLARKLMPEQEQNIKQFEATYKIDLNDVDANIQALKWSFRDTFFWKLMDLLPKLTTDPKKLAYLRLPFRDLYKAIRHSYNALEKKPQKLYIVTVLNPEEQEKLKKNLDNFVIFTTFMRGFTKKSHAIKARKLRTGSILYEIILSTKHRDANLDFGFVANQQEGQNVIFNIYNFFQINETDDMGQKQVTLGYGSLAEASEKRINPKRIRRTPFEEDLLRNYDYIEDLMKRVNSQAAILQMSGYFQESIEVYERKSDFLGKTQASLQIMDKYHLQVADAYKLSDNYKKALQVYAKISTEQMKLIAQVHIAELYHQSKDNERFNNTVKGFEPKIPELLNIDPPEAFKAMNYVAFSLMNEGKYKQAKGKFKQIMPKMTKYYDYRYEGIPLVHDMFRNYATCESKTKNYNEALNMLRSTKGWQKVCEGITPNYELTETMIQQVHLSKGDEFKVKESQKEVENIKKSLAVDFSIGDQIYMNKSRVVVNLNESMVAIDF